jgi:hypothetical protein
MNDLSLEQFIPSRGRESISDKKYLSVAAAPPGFVYAQVPSVHIVAVKRFNGGVRLGGLHFNKAEASRLSGFPIRNKFNGLDGAVLLKEFPDLLLGCGKRQIAHIDTFHVTLLLEKNPAAYKSGTGCFSATIVLGIGTELFTASSRRRARVHAAGKALSQNNWKLTEAIRLDEQCRQSWSNCLRLGENSKHPPFFRQEKSPVFRPLGGGGPLANGGRQGYTLAI